MSLSLLFRFWDVDEKGRTAIACLNIRCPAEMACHSIFAALYWV